jgi:hypothetical protein
MNTSVSHKSAMQVLSYVLTQCGIAHVCDPAEDDSTDDNIDITDKTSEGHEMHVQCATTFSPRGQLDYQLSVKDEECTFHHILDSVTSDPKKVAKVITEFISGKRKIRK